MSNWITGKELMALWDIEGFELFNCLKEGLQPYTQYGHIITNTDTLEHAPTLSLKQCIARARRANMPTLVEPPSRAGRQPFQRFTPMSEQEILQRAKKDYESQPLHPVNPPLHHMSFTLPLDDSRAAAAISTAMNLRFKKDEAAEFAKRHGYSKRTPGDPEVEGDKLHTSRSEPNVDENAPHTEAHSPGFTHSPDYRSVTKNGESFSLTSRQAAAIQLLHEAHQDGNPELSLEHIFDQIGSGATKPRMRDIFKQDPKAKEALIAPGKKKGLFRLNI